MTQARWGVVITGHMFDLKSWSEALQAPFDPWVETHDDIRILRSSNFDDLKKATEVHDAGASMITMLNATLALDRDTRAVTIGGVVEVDATGVIREHIIMALGSAEFRIHGAAVAVVTRDRDGKVVVPGPSPSKPQRWMQVAEGNELLADALTYYSRAEWFDIYKSLECLKALSGYQDVLAEAGVSKAQVSLLSYTANSLHRHRKGGFAPPGKPMSLKEAHDVIGRLLRTALDRAG